MIKWKAIYEDGTFLDQFNEDGSENKYFDIERRKLRKFNIYKDDILIYSLFLKPLQRLIFRHRTLLHMAQNGDKRYENIYLVGYQQTFDTIQGLKNVTVINYIFEDGHMELDDTRDNLELIQPEF